MSWKKLIVFAFVSTLDHGFCHSEFQGYFSRRTFTGPTSEISKGSLAKVVATQLIKCAQKCVVTPRCNSYFYSRSAQECVLHENILPPSNKKQNNGWTYYLRKGQSKAQKTNVLVMFANYALVSPYSLDLATYNWTSYHPGDCNIKDMKYSSGKGPLVYDAASQTMYFTDIAIPMGYLYAMPLRVLDDLNRPNITIISKKRVVGVSMDTKKRMLFFLRDKKVISMSLETRKVQVIATVTSDKTFTGYCNSAVDESRRRVFFHMRSEKKIQWVGYTDRQVHSKNLQTKIIHLTADLKGDRLIYTNGPKFDEAWSLSMDSFKTRRLFSEDHNIVYPFDEGLLVIGINHKKVTIRSRDGSRMIREVQLLGSCISNACVETTILKLEI